MTKGRKMISAIVDKAIANGSPVITEQRETLIWQNKAIRATEGTQFGAIIRCALGVEGLLVPRFVGKAVITSDGFVQCSFVTRDGEHKHMAFVGAWSDVERNMEGLAAHLKLTRAQAVEFADVIQAWISIDYRS